MPKLYERKENINLRTINYVRKTLLREIYKIKNAHTQDNHKQKAKHSNGMECFCVVDKQIRVEENFAIFTLKIG